MTGEVLLANRRQQNERIVHAFAMCSRDLSTAEKHVVTREAKTWKSRVSATLQRVPSRVSGCEL